MYPSILVYVRVHPFLGTHVSTLQNDVHCTAHCTDICASRPFGNHASLAVSSLETALFVHHRRHGYSTVLYLHGVWNFEALFTALSMYT